MAMGESGRGVWRWKEGWGGRGAHRFEVDAARREPQPRTPPKAAWSAALASTCAAFVLSNCSRISRDLGSSLHACSKSALASPKRSSSERATPRRYRPLALSGCSTSAWIVAESSQAQRGRGIVWRRQGGSAPQGVRKREGASRAGPPLALPLAARRRRWGDARRRGEARRSGCCAACWSRRRLSLNRRARV